MMLIQFMLKNVLSFREETIFDMTAIHAYKEHPCNLIQTTTHESLVKVASIYGANASGKSNLYYAMKYFQNIILESFNNTSDDNYTTLEKYYAPFSFEETQHNSEFEIILLLNDNEYKYGFEYNSQHIVTEWLYRKSLKTNRTITILERSNQNIKFGASVRKECDLYKNQIPHETLALSFFNKLNLATNQFKTVYSGIKDILMVPTALCEDTQLLEKILPSVIDANKNEFIHYLNAIDTGIKDIEYIENDKNVLFITYHKGKNQKKYPLNLYNESQGTIKSILLYIYAKTAFAMHKTIFIDELNVKLHPLLLKFFIDLFYDQNSKAQLIYTTHDTTLMDKRFFRRDQIWFVQKDEYGYSELSSLADFKIRSDASFEKDYLAGVYGGIPTFEEFDMEVGES